MQLIEHVKKHKEAYTWGSVGIVVGVSGVILFRSPKIIQTAVTHGNYSPIIQFAQPIRRGHPGYVVRIKETGEIFSSMRRAQEVLNVSHKKLQDLVEVVGVAK